jgi:erythromycin esterase
MPPPARTVRSLLFCLTVGCVAGPVFPAPLAAQPSCRALEVGVVIHDELGKGETHCYEVHLAAGDSALVTAEHLSTFFPNNLLIRRIEPTGDTIARKANRQLVREVASFVAPQTGIYRFEVTRLEHRQGPDTGPYVVRVGAVLDAAERRQREAALAADPRVAWLGEHVSPLRSIDPDDEDFSDLMPLVDALEGVRVVALGEATHGSGAAFLAKTRILKFLHQVMGFDVLVWESSVYGMRKASDHLRAGGGAAESLRRGVFDIWLDSDQMRPLMAYLDRTARAGRPMELAGVDLQFSGMAPGTSFLDDLQAYLSDVGVSTDELAEGRSVGDVLRHVIEYRYASGEEAAPDEAVHARVLDALQRWEEAAEADATPNGAFWAGVLWNTRRYVENVLDQAALRAREDATDEEWERVAGVRDRVMGRNLVWLARELYPDRKIVVWAATGHLLENPDGIVHARAGESNPLYDRGYSLNSTLGHEAGLDLGNELYVLAVTARSGRHGKDTWIGYPYHLQPDQVEEFELEELIAATGVEHGLLDVRRRRPGDAWLGRPLIGRGIDRYIPWRAAWRQHLDGLLFVREMTPSTTGGTGIEQ